VRACSGRRLCARAELTWRSTGHSTPRTSSCCAATTSAPRSTASTASTMSASEGAHVLAWRGAHRRRGPRRYNIKLWKTFTDCFNTLPVAAIIDEKIFCIHGGLSPELHQMDQLRRIARPTDVPDSGRHVALRGSCAHKARARQAFCATCCGRIRRRTWTAGARTTAVCRSHLARFVSRPRAGLSMRVDAHARCQDIVTKFLDKHDLDLVARAHQVRALAARLRGGRSLPPFVSRWLRTATNSSPSGSL
jgi:hypothetical protein